MELRIQMVQDSVQHAENHWNREEPAKNVAEQKEEAVQNAEEQKEEVAQNTEETLTSTAETKSLTHKNQED